MVLYLLQSSIQALIDMGARILSLMGLKPPTSYSGIAKELNKLGIITEREAEEMRKMIGFRNIVVHGYVGIDEKKLKEILSKKLYRNILKIAEKIITYAGDNGIDP